MTGLYGYHDIDHMITPEHCCTLQRRALPVCIRARERAHRLTDKQTDGTDFILSTTDTEWNDYMGSECTKGRLEVVPGLGGGV